MRLRLMCSLLCCAIMLLAGCKHEVGPTQSGNAQHTESTAEYGWTSGESPVPEARIGYMRAGLCDTDHAVSPTGIYFVEKVDNADATYIRYADNGSDTFIKLCGRPDCTHITPDCNSYLYQGSDVSYYGGYLYAVSGEGAASEECKLVRMDSSGANHVTILNLTEFAKEHDGDYVVCDRITEGVCLFSVYYWEEVEVDVDSVERQGTHSGYYYYKLDGSMEEPEDAHTGGLACYSCGDVFLTYFPEAVNGGELGSYWDWNPDTNTATFLTDHPGQPGWFGPEEGYYFKDGAICRLTYATQTEEIMVNTGLEGDYYTCVLPDCIIVCSRNSTRADTKLYFYNWSFQLIETVKVNYSFNQGMEYAIVAESSERIFLTNEFGGLPKYYINKSELGSGSASVHAFQYA